MELTLSSFLDFSDIEMEIGTALTSFISTKIINLSSTKCIVLSKDDIQLIYNFISSNPMDFLIKLAVKEPFINRAFTLSCFNCYWDEMWQNCGKNKMGYATKNVVSINGYQPQPTLPTFELLKGLYFYGLYNKYKKSKEMKDKRNAVQYLHEAARLGNFTALNILCTQALRVKSQYDNPLYYAQLAADLYWTPGYLLLAVVYLQQQNYYKALINFMIAEKLIPSSEAMIINAYQGKTLLEIFSPLAQQLEAKNWNEVKIKLAKIANIPISTLHSKVQQKILQILRFPGGKSNIFEPYRATIN